LTVKNLIDIPLPLSLTSIFAFLQELLGGETAVKRSGGVVFEKVAEKKVELPSVAPPPPTEQTEVLNCGTTMDKMETTEVDPPPPLEGSTSPAASPSALAVPLAQPTFREPALPIPTKSLPITAPQIGSRLRVFFHDTQMWYPGTIISCNPEGSFNLKYDDGDEEIITSLDEEGVELIDETLNLKTTQQTQSQEESPGGGRPAKKIKRSDLDDFVESDEEMHC